jgi:hypothetical protein
VGKTELAKSVAHMPFVDEKKTIRVDMSEPKNPRLSSQSELGLPWRQLGQRILTSNLAWNRGVSFTVTPGGNAIVSSQNRPTSNI